MSGRRVTYQEDQAEPGVVRIRLEPEVSELAQRAKRLAEALNDTMGALAEAGVTTRLRTWAAPWRDGGGRHDVVSMEVVVPVNLASVVTEPAPQPGGGW